MVRSFCSLRTRVFRVAECLADGLDQVEKASFKK